VQGQLRKEDLSVEVETQCRHCGRALHFEIDSNMQVSVRDSGASPLVFMPDVDWAHFAQPTIIDSY
jgi:hypothetical protein